MFSMNRPHPRRSLTCWNAQKIWSLPIKVKAHHYRGCLSPLQSEPIHCPEAKDFQSIEKVLNLSSICYCKFVFMNLDLKQGQVFNLFTNRTKKAEGQDIIWFSLHIFLLRTFATKFFSLFKSTTNLTEFSSWSAFRWNCCSFSRSCGCWKPSTSLNWWHVKISYIKCWDRIRQIRHEIRNMSAAWIQYFQRCSNEGSARLPTKSSLSCNCADEKFI